MGLNYEDEESGEENKEKQRILKQPRVVIFIFFLVSMVLSITGGCVLGWWVYKYHAANRELWMVPFGLILLLTPIVVWFSLIVSDLSSASHKSKEEDHQVMPRMNRLVYPIDDGFYKIVK
ncbi:putative ATP-synthase-associated protein [Senna tora]|uniref:Putative ATP-synthase-associated protein n=1 Tax=Senna tora TaxID=362788 RepID=A0A834TPV8_9FABA|nr:putative ATP-synthase-associated protein [Senna tora]